MHDPALPPSPTARLQLISCRGVTTSAVLALDGQALSLGALADLSPVAVPQDTRAALQQCRVQPAAGANGTPWWLRNLGCTLRCTVNAASIGVGEALHLQDGDIIELGLVQIRFQAGASAPLSATPTAATPPAPDGPAFRLTDLGHLAAPTSWRSSPAPGAEAPFAGIVDAFDGHEPASAPGDAEPAPAPRQATPTPGVDDVPEPAADHTGVMESLHRQYLRLMQNPNDPQMAGRWAAPDVPVQSRAPSFEELSRQAASRDLYDILGHTTAIDPILQRLDTLSEHDILQPPATVDVLRLFAPAHRPRHRRGAAGPDPPRPPRRHGRQRDAPASRRGGACIRCRTCPFPLARVPPMKPTPYSMPPAAQSFRQWLHGDTLGVALRRAEDDIRSHPTNTAARWLLFELLCIQGSWDRALKQLQTWATLSAGSEGVAHTMRGLIRGEHQRVAVLTGQQTPVPVVELTPWMVDLAQAIRLNTQGDHVQADVARARALDAAANVPGQGNLGAFAWITDSDTRLGPVCEVVAQGSYRWLGFHDLRSLHIEAPQRLLDLVWTSAQLVLRDGTPLRAMLPTRYPLPAAPATVTDRQLLGRETRWTEVGETGVFAAGQKIWATDQGDWPLQDIRDCTFDVAGDAYLTHREGAGT